MHGAGQYRALDVRRPADKTRSWRCALVFEGATRTISLLISSVLLISAFDQRARTAATGTRQMITRPMTRLIPASAS